MPATSTEGSTDSAPYRLDDQVGFLLRRAYQVASANLVAAIGAQGLTAPQFALLARLHERGPVSQNELGRLIVMEPANVRDVVLRLERRGLVDTAAAADDRRRRQVRLTPAGRRLITAMIPLERACTVVTLEALTDAERRRLIVLLRKLLGD